MFDIIDAWCNHEVHISDASLKCITRLVCEVSLGDVRLSLLIAEYRSCLECQISKCLKKRLIW